MTGEPVIGRKRRTGCPFRSTKNLTKFHLIELLSRPLCLAFKYWYNGVVDGPFTSPYFQNEKMKKKKKIDERKIRE